VADPEDSARGRRRGPVGCAPSWSAGGRAPAGVGGEAPEAGLLCGPDYSRPTIQSVFVRLLVCSDLSNAKNSRFEYSTVVCNSLSTALRVL